MLQYPEVIVMILDATLPFGPTPEEMKQRRQERWGREMDDIDVKQSNDGFFCIVLLAFLTLMALTFIGASFV